jgi:hypothetical protein
LSGIGDAFFRSDVHDLIRLFACKDTIFRKEIRIFHKKIVSLHQITIRTNDDEKEIALCYLCAWGRDGS